MGLFKSLKGKGPDHVGGEESNNYEQYQDSTEKRRLFGHSPAQEEQFAPPPGPPPNYSSKSYEPPPGPPPPKQVKSNEEYAPPAGPPPGQANTGGDNLPPYHDWSNAVPDTSLLPPPPTVRHEASMNNSSEDDAIRAHEWVDVHPLFTPSKPHPGLYDAVQRGDINLVKPYEMHGDLAKTRLGVWKGKAKATRDCILLSALPLYFAAEDSPSQTEIGKTIYFEIKILSIGSGRRRQEDSGLAIGYCAQPYPSWRLPGHERASLGVHGDDGRRFINDSYGGMDFTDAFQKGDTLGLGMVFTPRTQESLGRTVDVEVFFTRNGSKSDGWNLFEEKDEASGNVDGLEGRWDLYAAIGLFGDLEFEAKFAREAWLYQPG